MGRILRPIGVGICTVLCTGQESDAQFHVQAAAGPNAFIRAFKPRRGDEEMEMGKKKKKGRCMN